MNKIFNYFVILNIILNKCGSHIVDTSKNKKQTFLIANETNDIFLRRSKRYLVFEKGASLTFQGNIAKSIIPPSPRGLNLIAEYTLSYELPTDFHFFQKKKPKTTKAPISTTTTHSHYQYHQQFMIPYNHDYYYSLHPEYLTNEIMRRKYSYYKKTMPHRKCLSRKFYEYKHKVSNICLRRGKRNDKWNFNDLSNSQRMLYDLIEKWSLLHGFLPRYCFMRTLCESAELLVPYGHSLLHDIIHILLRYTTPWAFHHKIFGRSLRQRYTIDECTKLYSPYCRVSWLDFITNMVYGSRAVDFMR